MNPPDFQRLDELARAAYPDQDARVLVSPPSIAWVELRVPGHHVPLEVRSHLDPVADLEVCLVALAEARRRA